MSTGPSRVHGSFAAAREGPGLLVTRACIARCGGAHSGTARTAQRTQASWWYRRGPSSCDGCCSVGRAWVVFPAGRSAARVRSVLPL